MSDDDKHSTPRTERVAQDVRRSISGHPASLERLRIGCQRYYELARQLEREANIAIEHARQANEIASRIKATASATLATDAERYRAIRDSGIAFSAWQDLEGVHWAVNGRVGLNLDVLVDEELLKLPRYVGGKS